MLKVIAFMDHFATPTQLVALRETEPPRQSDKWKSWRAAINLIAINVESTAMEMLEVHEAKVESEKASDVKRRKQQSKKTMVAAVSKRIVNSCFHYKTYHPRKVSSTQNL